MQPINSGTKQQIACLDVPDFGVAVARRADHSLEQKPLVLLDEGGRVLAADLQAAATGIGLGWPERQARARCPEALYRPAARYPLLEAQEALYERVKAYTDRWQPAGSGILYVVPPPTLSERATGRAAIELLGWCQALAISVRTLGWEPALGITGSKFGAGVAGQAAQANEALLIASDVQRAFLARQPVKALPLDTDILLQLRHLGIRTLGQFARLPAAGVVARFGPAGRTAQRWAQGQDDRPVIPPWEAPEASSRIEFDGPLADRDRLLAALGQRVDRLLRPLQERLQAAGRLNLLVTRADGRVVTGSHTFALPTAAAGAVRLGLAAALDRVPWEGQPAAEITLVLAGITDAPGQQLALFDFNLDNRARLAGLLRSLSARFGPETFRLAVLTDPQNPVSERRTGWQGFDEW